MLDETTVMFTMGVVSVIAILFSLYVKFIMNRISDDMKSIYKKVDDTKTCMNNIQLETLTKISEISERVAKIESTLNSR